MKQGEKHNGWGAQKLEPWREAERSLKATRDPEMVVTLAKLRFMERSDEDTDNSLDGLLYGFGESA